MSSKIEMADVVRALEKVRGGPVLTSNQCWDLAQALNAADPVVEPLIVPLSGPKEWLDSHRAAPVVERQPEVFGYWLAPKDCPGLARFHRVTPDDAVIDSAAVVSYFDITSLYTAPPELAELQATIAQLTTENEGLYEIIENHRGHIATVPAAENSHEQQKHNPSYPQVRSDLQRRAMALLLPSQWRCLLAYLRRDLGSGLR
jgi:hypothetical protein